MWDVYIYIHMCSIFITCEYMEDFTHSTYERKYSSWKIRHRWLDSSMMKKTAADSKAKGKKPGSTHGLLG